MLLPQPNADEAADVVAINQLAAAYSEAISRFEVEEAVQVYAPDGVLATPTTEDAIGREAIVTTIKATVSCLDFVFQSTALGLVRVDGDRASARFTVTEWARRSSDGLGILFLGYYDDDIARLDEGWRFTRRHLVPRTMGRLDFLGGKVHDLAALRAQL